MNMPRVRLDTILIVIAALCATLTCCRIAGVGAAAMCGAITFLIIAVEPEHRTGWLMAVITAAVAFLLMVFSSFPHM